METIIHDENISPVGASLPLPLSERAPLNETSSSALNIKDGNRRSSTGAVDTSIIKRSTIRTVDLSSDTSGHATLNAQREVKKLKSQVQERDRQLMQMEKQLHVTRGQLDELQLREQKHRNASKEIKKQLSSQETSVKAKSAALARVSGQLHRLAEAKENRSRRKNLQLQELAAEFDQMEESYCNQLGALEEELVIARVAAEESVAAEGLLTADLESTQLEKQHATALLMSSLDQVARFTRELERTKEFQLLELMAVRQCFQSEVDSAATDTHREVTTLIAMQQDLKEEYEQQTRKFGKLYESFEAQREEKIDAQLRVVALVNELKTLKVAHGRAIEQLGQSESELIVAKELTEEVARNSSANARIQGEKISTLEQSVESLSLLLEESQLTGAMLQKEIDSMRSQYEARLAGEQSTLQSLCKSLEEEKESRGNEVASMQASMDALAAEYEGTTVCLKAELSEINKKREQLQEQLEMQHMEAAREIESLKQNLEAAAADRDAEQQQHAASMEVAEKECEMVRAELQSERDRAVASQKEVSALKTSNDNMKRELCELRSSHAEEKEKLEEALASVGADIERREGEKAREQTVRSKVIAALKKDNADLADQLEETHSEYHVKIQTLEDKVAVDAAAVIEQQEVSNSLMATVAEQKVLIAEFAERAVKDAKRAEELLCEVTSISASLQANLALSVQAEKRWEQVQEKLEMQHMEAAKEIESLKQNLEAAAADRDSEQLQHAASMEVAEKECEMVRAELQSERDRAVASQKELSGCQSLLINLKGDFDALDNCYDQLKASYEQILMNANNEKQKLQEKIALEKKNHSEIVSALQSAYEMDKEKDRAIMQEECTGALQLLREEIVELQNTRHLELLEAASRYEEISAKLESEREWRLLQEQGRASDKSKYEELLSEAVSKTLQLSAQIEANRKVYDEALVKSLQYSAADAEKEVLNSEIERYRSLYEKESCANNDLLGHQSHSHKVRYVEDLKQQINNLLEENRELMLKKSNLNNSASSSVAGTKRVAKRSVAL